MFPTLKSVIYKIIYHNDPELLSNPFKKSQDRFIFQIMLVTAFTLLTSGVFLTGFAIYLGLQDELISYITILPNICGLFLLFSGYFLERFRSKKSAIIITVLIYKSLICAIVLLPWLIPEDSRPGVLLGTLMIAFTLQAVSNVAINTWFVSVVPENIRGRYFAIRQSFALLVMIGVPLITGRFMDLVHNKLFGFSVLYGAGLLITIAEVINYLRIEETTPEIIDKSPKLTEVIRQPFLNQQFRYFVTYVFLFYIVLWLAHSFTQVYLLRYLKLPYTFLTSLNIFSALLQLIFYRIWGKISDQYGHRRVLNLAIWFFVGETFFYAITNNATAFIWLPAAYLFSALGNSGFLISVFNERFAIIPKNRRSIYDGFFNMIIGIAFLIAPLMGGVIKNAIGASPLVQQNLKFGEFRLLYLVSCSGIIVLQLTDIYYKMKQKSALQRW